MKHLQTIARIVDRNSAFRSASTRTRTQQKAQGRQRPRPAARSQNQKNEKSASHYNHQNSNNAAYQRSQETHKRLLTCLECQKDGYGLRDIDTYSCLNGCQLGSLDFDAQR